MPNSALFRVGKPDNEQSAVGTLGKSASGIHYYLKQPSAIAMVEESELVYYLWAKLIAQR